MFTVEDFEKFNEDSETTTKEIHSIKSTLPLRDAMLYQEEQTASDKALEVGENVLKSIYNGTVVQYGGGAANFLRALHDVNVEQLNRDYPDRMQGDSTLLEDIANSSVFQPYEIKADTAAGEYAYNLIQGAGQLAVQIPANMALGPAGSTALMGMTIAGQDYKELREQGVDPETALKAGAIDAAIQAQLESIGLGAITKSFPANTLLKQQARSVILRGLEEGATEWAEQYPDEITKIWAMNKDKSMDEILQLVIDALPSITKHGIYAGSIGWVLGGGVSGVNLAIDRVTGRHIEHAMERAAQREAYTARIEQEESRINRIKESGENPARAAVIINDNLQNQTVYVDGEALAGYAQEKGAEKVAESLGVSVEDIEKAAASGDTVDVKLGNFEATCAAFDGFFQEVKDGTAFEDGGYTPKKEQAEQERIKQAQERYAELRDQFKSEEDRIISEFAEAGVGKQLATGQVELLRRFAENINPDYALSIMQSYKVRRGENGEVQAGYGQFAGENAETADKVKLTEAQTMESEGKAADEIYKATGWFKGLDNKWRFEIKDNFEGIDFTPLLGDDDHQVTLKEIYKNPKLYKAYPFLRNIKIYPNDFSGDDGKRGITGTLKDDSLFIELNENLMRNKPERIKETLTHEIQHIIQAVERFAAGGARTTARKLIAEEIQRIAQSEDAGDVEALSSELDSSSSDYDLYRRLGGEQEARETARRAKIQNEIATVEKHIKEARRKGDKAALKRAQFAKVLLERQNDGTPSPHQSDAIIVFDGKEIPYSLKQNEISADVEEQNTKQAKSRSKESGLFDAVKSLFQSAWHGSPHKFAKFDLGAIGTGEGAQVHGWGLYFAQDRKIAEQYKESLDMGASITIEGDEYRRNNQYNWENKDTGYVVQNTSVFELALTSFSQANGDVDKAINSLQKDVVLSQKSNEEEWWITNLQNAIKFLQRDGATWKLDNQTSQLYQVEIPDNDVMLDEQKTFDEQPEKVQEALKKLFNELVPENIGENAIQANYTGKEIYRVLNKLFQGPRTTSETLNEYGIEGITYEGGMDGRCFVVFDDQAINIIDTYNQEVNGQGEIKGKYNPYDNVVTMFKGADASTVIHETWHFFVEQMWNMVDSGNASEQTVKDFETLLSYAGMTREEWANADLDGRRKAHEKLAEAGETYIMEGKSPSYELRRVFRNFAKWLKAIYATIQRSENYAELTDDVREVFDRMLAAEDDIAHMERVNGYFSKLPDAITENMSDETRAKVEDFIVKAREKAEDILTRRYLRNYVKDRREQIKKFKEEIRPSVEREVDNYPVYKCGYTKKDVERYRRIKAQGLAVGEDVFLLNADLAAEQNGFSSADEMMKAVEAAPAKSEAIKRRINERVLELSPESERDFYENAIRESLYNEDAALLIGVEQQLIEEYAGKAKERQANAEVAAARKQQAKNAARDDITKMNVKEATRTNKFITAERNAAMKSAKLLAQKKFDEALTQKNLQAYWHAMVSESIKIARRQKQYEKFLKKQVGLKREAWLNETHFAAISQLFTRMGIAKPIHKEAAAASEFKTLQEYATAMEGQFDCVDIAPWILEGSTPISDTNALTLEQYEDVVNAVKNIKAIVKAQKGVDMFSTQEAWTDTKAHIMGMLAPLKTLWEPNPNKVSKPSKKEQWFAGLETMDTVCDMLDGGRYGWFSQHWNNLMKRCQDREYDHRKAYDDAETEAYKKWVPDKAAEAAANEEVYYEELGTSVTKHTLVRMLMNLGNKENSQRICETVPVRFEKSTLWVMPDESLAANQKELRAMREEARKATRKNLIDFLGKVLTEEDVKYAQRRINAMEMFWGERVELDKRTKGFAPKKVEATPVLLDIGGQQVVLQGGYCPLLRYGETGSHPASAEVQPDEELQGRRIRTYHTNTSSSKARTNARYAVDLRLGTERNWIYESIHDLCWREAMSDFRRVLNDQEVYAMLKSKMGLSRMNLFKELLEVSADGRNSKPLSEFEKSISETAGWLTSRTTNALVMCSLKISSQNLADCLLYGNTVEGYTMADNISALGRYMLCFDLGKWKEMQDFVFSKSAYMEERSLIPDVTIRDMMADEKEKKWQKVLRETTTKMFALTDNATAIPNWMQAYNKKINEGWAEQDAIDFADTVVRRVKGSSRNTEISSMQRSKVLKPITMFQSFFNARFNEFVRMERYATNQWTDGKKAEAFSTVASYVMAKVLAQAMLALVLAGENPFGIDDEDKWPNLIKELKSQTFSMFGPIGQAASAAVGAAAGMREFDYRMSAIESTVNKGIGAIRAVRSDKKTAAEKVEVATNFATLVSGAPMQITRIFWNAFDIVFNNMSPEIGDIMRRRPKKERK